MELLVSQFTTVMVILLVLVGIAWVLARVITASERRLISSTALVLAGLFFVARGRLEPALALVGLSIWTAGVVMFGKAIVRWRRSDSSRAWPLALVFLLPPAFFGALLLGGVIYSVLAPPARAAMLALP